ncbi:hypothetical protein M422DRAFT_28940 [Sphaerobolus stellatus SS14]|nr:hypothetical protein M422DRAFT_28940 [Sphaerobolus stellatus SS14]
MTTIPARLARMTRTSSSPQEARTRVIQLYRDWYRAAPEIVAMYGLPVSASLIRQRVREEFERTRYITDVRLVDRLLLRWHQELQETLNVWKQEPHVMGMLLVQKNLEQKSFLDKFYKGRDDEGVVPQVITTGSGL